MHHFGAIGLANGLAVLGDTETGTYWDHITGEAFMGPLEGHQLDVFPIQLTTVAAVVQESPEAPVFVSSYRSFQSMILGFVGRKGFTNFKGILPGRFLKTMHQEVDPRLPRLEQGLGIMHKGKAKFFPMRSIPKQGSIEDEWGGGTLVLSRGEIDRVPRAVWKTDGKKPMQLLSRWYGFAFTYPTCDVYKLPEDKS